ncbi:hypothetical protein ACP8Y2_09475 [Herpetosiphon llansteffanensis]
MEHYQHEEACLFQAIQALAEGTGSLDERLLAGYNAIIPMNTMRVAELLPEYQQLLVQFADRVSRHAVEAPGSDDHVRQVEFITIARRLFSLYHGVRYAQKNAVANPDQQAVNQG